MTKTIAHQYGNNAGHGWFAYTHAQRQLRGRHWSVFGVERHQNRIATGRQAALFKRCIEMDQQPFRDSQKVLRRFDFVQIEPICNRWHLAQDLARWGVIMAQVAHKQIWLGA